MRILFDIVHPAQVHFFKQAIGQLKKEGHEVLVTARAKDVALELLDALGIKYLCLSRKSEGLWGMAAELVVRDVRLVRCAMAFRPDVMVARVGISAGAVGALLGVPTVIFDDMEHARLQAAIGMTFATYICTGLGYYRNFGSRQVRFRGSPVLSYMAPKYFQPDPQRLRTAGLDPSKRYIFVRLVSWAATHDVGRKGIQTAALEEAISRLSRYGRVVISSEDQLPDSLSAYQNPVPVEYLHDLLSFASLSLVEGGTMAAESAVLGVPVICLGSYDFGYLRALEHEYGMIFRPGTFEQGIIKAEELLQDPELARKWQAKRQKLLAESDDVVEFMLAMIARAAREHPVRRVRT